MTPIEWMRDRIEWRRRRAARKPQGSVSPRGLALEYSASRLMRILTGDRFCLCEACGKPRKVEWRNPRPWLILTQKHWVCKGCVEFYAEPPKDAWIPAKGKFYDIGGGFVRPTLMPVNDI